MLETPGRLRSEAQEIQKKAPTFVAREASSFKYKAKQQEEERMEVDPGVPAMKAGTKAALLEDAKTMKNLEAKGRHQLAQAQAKQAKAYANRKRPRNRRVEPLEVGANCRISPMVPPGAKGKGKLVWSTQVYRITSFGRGRVQVVALEDAQDTQDLLASCVLPIATTKEPINKGSDSE